MFSPSPLSSCAELVAPRPDPAGAHPAFGGKYCLVQPVSLDVALLGGAGTDLDAAVERELMTRGLPPTLVPSRSPGAIKVRGTERGSSSRREDSYHYLHLLFD